MDYIDLLIQFAECSPKKRGRSLKDSSGAGEKGGLTCSQVVGSGQNKGNTVYYRTAKGKAKIKKVKDLIKKRREKERERKRRVDAKQKEYRKRDKEAIKQSKGKKMSEPLGISPKKERLMSVKDPRDQVKLLANLKPEYSKVPELPYSWNKEVNQKVSTLAPGTDYFGNLTMIRSQIGEQTDLNKRGDKGAMEYWTNLDEIEEGAILEIQGGSKRQPSSEYYRKDSDGWKKLGREMKEHYNDDEDKRLERFLTKNAGVEN